MKQRINSLAILLSLASMQAAALEVSPTIVARSQGRDAARKLVGVTDKVHLYDRGWYMNASAMPEYEQTFKGGKIARALFGSDVQSCETILVQGSAVANRNANAWLADYFYLAPDYNSSFSIKPKIENFLVDLDLYVGCDDVLRGLYFRAYGPITWSKWNIEFSEACDISTTGSYAPGYFNIGGVANAQLNQTFGQYASGNAPLNTSGTVANPTTGTEFRGLNYGKITGCQRSRTGFAELRMEFGWDFLQNENGHLGLNAQLVAPTGSKRRAQYAFDSVIGNGNHWEVGGGVTGHYMFWRSADEDRHAGVYLDASFTHINVASEQRTFDLCGKPNSRYMLAQNMGMVQSSPPASNLQVEGSATAALASPTIPSAQFLGIFTPVANLTTLNINVRASIQVDLALALNYTSNHMTYDLGYNFWYRSAEKFTYPPRPEDQCCPSLCDCSPNSWALKGDAAVFGYTTGLVAYPLSATESGATIHSGTNSAATGGTTACPGVPVNTNCGVDNAQFAFAVEDSAALFIQPTITSGTGNQIKTSVNPLFINCSDINFQATKSLSNKVFAHASYDWELYDWNPYIGIGGDIEWGSNGGGCCDSGSGSCNTSCATSSTGCATSTTSCGSSSGCASTSLCSAPCANTLNYAPSQWAVWVKGGVNFN